MAKGLGVVVVVIFLLISKAPRLLKGVFGDRQPPAPVQMPNKDARAIRELLEEARQKPPLQPIPVEAKRPADKGPLPLPPLSDGPIDPQAEPPE